MYLYVGVWQIVVVVVQCLAIHLHYLSPVSQK